MKLYFGKISTKLEKEQIDQGYYRAPRGDMVKLAGKVSPRQK